MLPTTGIVATEEGGLGSEALETEAEAEAKAARSLFEMYLPGIGGSVTDKALVWERGGSGLGRFDGARCWGSSSSSEAVE